MALVLPLIFSHMDAMQNLGQHGSSGRVEFLRGVTVETASGDF